MNLFSKGTYRLKTKIKKEPDTFENIGINEAIKQNKSTENNPNDETIKNEHTTNNTENNIVTIKDEPNTFTENQSSDENNEKENEKSII